MNEILINARVQVIYYQTDKDELGIAYATSDKRITLDEAFDIVVNRKIKVKDILKVKYEFIEFEIPIKDLENYVL